MTRILVQRGSCGSSSSNPNRASSSSLPSSSTTAPSQPHANISQVTVVKDDDFGEDVQEHLTVDNIVEFSVGDGDSNKAANADDISLECSKNSQDTDGTIDVKKMGSDDLSKDLTRKIGEMKIMDRESEGSSSVSMCSHPPPPPVPPPKPSSGSPNSRRIMPGGSNSPRLGSSRRAIAWPVVPVRSSPTGSKPSSPRSHCDAEGYNSADEQNPSFGSCYDDALHEFLQVRDVHVSIATYGSWIRPLETAALETGGRLRTSDPLRPRNAGSFTRSEERERQFESDIRRAKGLEVRKMMEDGNCLFRAVADQVYGDCEHYDLVRQMCIDYMERERDHFSQFITEGFTSYFKRKRRDKVYGNNIEIQALAEMYNRPIHIYSYTTEPINIFQGSYDTDTPPIRLSYHHGNHYNSLFDPRRLTIGAGLGFSSLRGRNADKDQIKAAIKAQQDQQIDNALLAEGRFYSDLELTEKEIERMVMEASRAEYIAADKFKQQHSCHKSSTSSAEPSSSGARPSVSEAKAGKETESEAKAGKDTESALSNSMQIVLSMGFSYLQAIEAYSIFGDDVDSMVCYLLETGNSSRRSKGKATE